VANDEAIRRAARLAEIEAVEKELNEVFNGVKKLGDAKGSYKDIDTVNLVELVEDEGRGIPLWD
jgi:hypothetical protein